MVTTVPPAQKHWGWGDYSNTDPQISSIDKKKIFSFISFLEISLVDCLKACDEIELWTKSTFLQTYVLLPAKKRSLNIEIFNKDLQLNIYYPKTLGYTCVLLSAKRRSLKMVPSLPGDLFEGDS